MSDLGPDPQSPAPASKSYVRAMAASSGGYGALLGALYPFVFALVAGFADLAIGDDHVSLGEALGRQVGVVLLGVPVGAIVGGVVGVLGGAALGLLTGSLVEGRSVDEPGLVKTCVVVNAFAGAVSLLLLFSLVKALGGEWDAILFVGGVPAVIAVVTWARLTKSVLAA